MTDDKTPYPSDAADKFLLRLPAGMRDQLKAAAKAANRTMNAEVVARLQASFESAGSDEAVKAIALRLAQTEINLHAATLESDDRLLDAHIAASCALNAVKFNELLGLDRPLEEEDFADVQRIYAETKEFLDEQSEDDFKETIAQLQAARDRFVALKDKPKRSLDQSLLAHYQIIRRNGTVSGFGPDATFVPPVPPVVKHAPQPSPNARKRVPKKP
jgi:hypothetical protein